MSLKLSNSNGVLYRKKQIINIIGIINIQFLSYEKRIQTNVNTSFYSPIIIGMAFAFGWTPCIGPILGSILTLAAIEGNTTKSILLLTVRE